MADVKKSRKKSAGYEMWRALKSNKLTVVCMVIIGILVLVSIFCDVLFDYEGVVIKQDVVNALKPPCEGHPFGTDSLGRDYFARVMYATRITLIIAVSTVLGLMACSIFIGGIAAYYGGWVDNLIMRILDIILAVPQTLFIICIVVVLGNHTIYIILTLVLASIPGSARAVRAEIMVNMQNEYVEAARAVGSKGMRTMLVHLLPNSMGTLLVRGTMAIAGTILSTASLGYLGLGIPAPAPEWGRMLSEAQEYMRMYPYLIILPGLFIMLTATVFNLFGDALRDAMDPRLRGYRRIKKRHIQKVKEKATRSGEFANTIANS